MLGEKEKRRNLRKRRQRYPLEGITFSNYGTAVKEAFQEDSHQTKQQRCEGTPRGRQSEAGWESTFNLVCDVPKKKKKISNKEGRSRTGSLGESYPQCRSIGRGEMLMTDFYRSGWQKIGGSVLDPAWALSVWKERRCCVAYRLREARTSQRSLKGSACTNQKGSNDRSSRFPGEGKKKKESRGDKNSIATGTRKRSDVLKWTWALYNQKAITTRSLVGYDGRTKVEGVSRQYSWVRETRRTERFCTPADTDESKWIWNVSKKKKIKEHSAHSYNDKKNPKFGLATSWEGSKALFERE